MFLYENFSSSAFYKFYHNNFHLETKHNVLQIAKFLQLIVDDTKSVRTKWQKNKDTCEQAQKNPPKIMKFPWTFYEFLSLLWMFKRIVWSLSWLYKPANTSKPLVGAKCWHAIIVCIMDHVSQTYHVFQVRV